MNFENSNKPDVTRRGFLEILGGGIALMLLPNSPKAQTEPRFYMSSLRLEHIESHKMKAIDSLVSGAKKYKDIWDHVRGVIFRVRDEQGVRDELRKGSLMSIPTSNQLVDVRDRCRPQLVELARNIPDTKHGIFVDGDKQTLYVVKNHGNMQIEFVKSYPISSSINGWSNALDSYATPTGLHGIAPPDMKKGEVNQGILGQVVSGLNKFQEHFETIPTSEGEKTFVRGLSRDAGDGVAEVVTDQYMLVSNAAASDDPHTVPDRGIRIHGTNREDSLGSQGSTGCIRMSNVDVRDLGQYMQTGNLLMGEYTNKHGKRVKGYTHVEDSTPVYIHATGGYMPRRIPKENQYAEPRPEEERQRPSTSSRRERSFNPFRNDRGQN